MQQKFASYGRLDYLSEFLKQGLKKNCREFKRSILF